MADVDRHPSSEESIYGTRGYTPPVRVPSFSPGSELYPTRQEYTIPFS